MTYRVHKSSNGEVFIRSKEDDFTACFKDQKWSKQIVFSHVELDEMPLVTDKELAKALILQAQQALSGNPVIA